MDGLRIGLHVWESMVRDVLPRLNQRKERIQFQTISSHTLPIRCFCGQTTGSLASCNHLSIRDPPVLRWLVDWLIIPARASFLSAVKRTPVSDAIQDCAKLDIYSHKTLSRSIDSSDDLTTGSSVVDTHIATWDITSRFLVLAF